MDSKRVKQILQENENVIGTHSKNRKKLSDLMNMLNMSSSSFSSSLKEILDFSKSLSADHRNKLTRSVNNAMKSMTDLKNEINRTGIDCSIKISALKYVNDNIRRDLGRREKRNETQS